MNDKNYALPDWLRDKLIERYGEGWDQEPIECDLCGDKFPPGKLRETPRYKHLCDRCSELSGEEKGTSGSHPDMKTGRIPGN